MVSVLQITTTTLLLSGRRSVSIFSDCSPCCTVHRLCLTHVSCLVSNPKYWESQVMIHWKRIDSLLIKRINSSTRINSFAWKLQENIDLEFFTVRIDPALVVSCVIKMPRRAGASGDPCTLIHFISVNDIWLLQIQDTLQMLRRCRPQKLNLDFPQSKISHRKQKHEKEDESVSRSLGDY